MINKKYYLEKAIEITKEHAKSSDTRNAEAVLEKVYAKLLELAEDVEK